MPQLRDLGLSEGDVRGRVRRGLLIALHPRVFAVGHRRLGNQAKLIAALLTCGPSSFLSHRTAAAVWGLRAMNPRRIEVTVPKTTALRRKDLVVHRTSDHSGITTRNGLRVSSVPRLLLESATTEKRSELRRLITQAIRKRVLDLDQVERLFAQKAHHPGITSLKAAFQAYRPRPDRKSTLEDALDELIEDTDIPQPLRNVTLDGWEVDCYWPQFKLAVELDGRPYHIAAQDLEKDKYKDGQLLLKGIRTLRITDTRFELEPDRIRSDLRRLTT
ncbi:MAG: hypothetical protein M3016_09070 [Actinomycetota bacterium]|nr:hypothetical protein [Actinomycetota bacterium]